MIFGEWVSCALFAVLALAQSGQPGLSATLDRDNIYLGDSAIYTVEVSNVESVSEPMLALPQSIAVEKSGDQSLNQSSVFIVNGQVRRSETIGHRYTYRLTPKAGGDIELPGPVMVVGGREIKGPTLKLHVVEPQAQEYVILHTRIERTGRFPLQPFRAVLRIFVKVAPPPKSNDPPLSFVRPPALNIPWATVVPEGLSAAAYEEWLSPLLVRGDPVGFTINELTTGRNDPFQLFNQARQAVFDLRGRRARAEDVTDVPALAGRETRYFVYSLTREFEPRRAGTFELQPTSVKGTFVSGIHNGRMAGELVFDLGGGATVTVDEPPIEGRPAGWSGAVGSRFSLRAELAPVRVRVGDPMTLTLALSGLGNIEQVKSPDLAADPELAAAFRVQNPTRELVDGSPLFTYSVRPVADSVTALPSIGFSYFDLDKERYVTVRSEPIPVVVDRIDSLAGGDIVTGTRSHGAREVTRADGLFGNVTDPREVRDDRPIIAYHAATLCGLSVAYALTAWLVGRRRRLLGDPVRIRRREAPGRARERVAKAENTLRSGAIGEGAEQLRLALSGLVADASGVPEAGLTAREVADHLTRLGAASDTRDKVAALLNACEGMRYGGGDAAAFLAGARPLVDRLIAELKANGDLP